MCCMARCIYGKCSDQQNPTSTEYFQIPLCKSGPDSQLINICICLVMSLAMHVYVAVLFT